MKYRYHWLFKLLALVLAMISGAVLWLGGCGLILGELGYYEDQRMGQQYHRVDNYCRLAAEAVFERFAWKDTGIEPKLFARFFRWDADVEAADALEYDFGYIIRGADGGEILDGRNVGQEQSWLYSDYFDVRRGYVTEMPKAEYYPVCTEYRDEGTYLDLNGQPLPALGEDVTACEYYVVSEDAAVNPSNISMESYRHASANGSDYTIYRLEYTHYDSYYVEVFMDAAQMVAVMDDPVTEEFLPRFLAQYSEQLLPMTIWGGIGLIMSVLFLALVAGGSPHRDGIKPDGLNQLPLDLYLGLAAVGGVGLLALTGSALSSMVWNSGYGNYDGVGGAETFCLEVMLLALIGAGVGLLVALFFMACSAQMKVGKNYWLRHTAVGLVWRYGWKFGKKIVLWCWSAVKKAVGWVADLFAALGRFCGRFWSLIPLCWQWLLVSGGLWLLMFIWLLLFIDNESVLFLFFGILITVLPVFYGAYCFGALRDAAKQMSAGNLNAKIDNKHLLGSFREFAGHLNALGDVCIESARKQMKSERMKSELVTNVSHDIKTPLTSIINYVDLLQKTDDEAQRAQYLEVLDRQSQKLKKLIEDLMDMSRANSGNMAVEITPTDVTEAVNQALGEFADILEGCGLTVMAKTPAEPVMALCDGRHLWRVLSNCLGNVVKYAMPGTRVYVDVIRREHRVEVSIKNISAQMLNISAGELMERFVRGDSSRNTEGNGLGLNIAKSLMELQNGSLELMVDGDLFKVVLTLNAG